LSYAEYLRSTAAQKPNCWGNERSFDPSDSECSGCRFRHSCAASIERESRAERGSSSSGSGTSIRVTGSGRRDDGVVGRYEGGQVEEHEKPIERFLKDAAAGALRGTFWEMYSFWRSYRIK